MSPNYWLRLLDDGTGVPEGSLSASVHRICHYTLQKQERGAATKPPEAKKKESSTPKKKKKKKEEEEEEEEEAVAFGAHTDATFFTVVPVAETPGLQVFAPGLGWLSPEKAVGQRRERAGGDGVGGGAGSRGAVKHGRDVVLMPGEFAQVLSRGAYQCAVHRVLRPVEDEEEEEGERGGGQGRARGEGAVFASEKRESGVGAAGDVADGESSGSDSGSDGGSGSSRSPRSRLSAPLLLRGRAGELLSPAEGEMRADAATGAVADADADADVGELVIPNGVTVTDLHRLLLQLFSEDNKKREGGKGKGC